MGRSVYRWFFDCVSNIHIFSNLLLQLLGKSAVILITLRLFVHRKCISNFSLCHPHSRLQTQLMFGFLWFNAVQSEEFCKVQWNLWITIVHNNTDILCYKDTSFGCRLLFSVQIAPWNADTSELQTLLARSKGVLISQVGLYKYAWHFPLFV
jgi:hypothetical protein